MKKLIPILILGLIATLLPSCCGLGGCNKENYTTKEVTKYKTVKREVNPGPKGGIPYEVEEKVAYTETVKVKLDCGKCGSSYCPSPGCCGTVGSAVLKRATAQGGSGEPHIGTIPTMKVLAP